MSLQSSSILSSSVLAEQIINIIRSNTLESISKNVEEHDPWDEGENGAAWCDNEISLFEDLYVMLLGSEYKGIDRSHIKLETEEIESVVDMTELLSRQSVPYLELLLKFMKKGGSECSYAFMLRDKIKDPNMIHTFLLADNFSYAIDSLEPLEFSFNAQ